MVLGEFGGCRSSSSRGGSGMSAMFFLVVGIRVDYP
jgi:hypothetical protein